MKTAVSIPDDIYEDAERLAKRLNKPRSQIYADALKEYLAKHDPDAITAAINEFCDDASTELRDPALAAASAEMLRRIEW